MGVNPQLTAMGIQIVAGREQVNVTGSRSARPDPAMSMLAFGRRVRERGGRDR
jgi:hypothetical protein